MLRKSLIGAVAVLGIALAGSVAGEELANPKFHPFWAKCEELGVLVFMHPLGTRELEPSGRLAGNGGEIPVIAARRNRLQLHGRPVCLRRFDTR